MLYSETTGIFFLRFQAKKLPLRVNKSDITRENAVNGDFLENEDNHESIKDENIWFDVFLQICYPCFNP